MGKVTISIPFVTWRGGRPRFFPSPTLRKLGYTGLDLKNPDGTWLTLDQAIEWSAAFAAEIAARRGALAEGKRPPRPKKPNLITVADVFAKMFERADMQIEPDAAIRRRKGIAAPKTIRWYKTMRDAIEAYDPELYLGPAAALSRPVARGLYEKLCKDKGLAMAQGMIAVLRRAWNLNEAQLRENPFLRLEVKAPPPRIRTAEPEEMEALIAAADAIGRADVGDAILMGLMTGQRQSDRHRLVERGRIDGEIVFRQGKTGAVVTVPALSQLEIRLAAARERRRGDKVQFAQVLIDERLKRPWPEKDDDTSYWIAYRQVLAAAVDGVPAEGSTDEAPLWKVPPCPALEGFRDQDLRDTCVTWLARAGCTIPEICTITGHSETSATTIMKHYLGKHPEMARSAMKKVAAWLSGKGSKL